MFFCVIFSYSSLINLLPFTFMDSLCYQFIICVVDSFVMRLIWAIPQKTGAMNVDSIIMTSTKYEVDKFTSLNDIRLWRLKICALLVQQGLLEALEGKCRLDVAMEKMDKKTLLEKGHIIDVWFFIVLSYLTFYHLHFWILSDIDLSFVWQTLLLWVWFFVIPQQTGAVKVDSIIMTSTKYEVEKFTSLNTFRLWQLKMCALLV